MRPGLLQKHQPPAWRNWPELTGAVGLFLLADTARLAAAESPGWLGGGGAIPASYPHPIRLRNPGSAENHE